MDSIHARASTLLSACQEARENARHILKDARSVPEMEGDSCAAQLQRQWLAGLVLAIDSAEFRLQGVCREPEDAKKFSGKLKDQKPLEVQE